MRDDFQTVREALDVLYNYTSDLANPPGEGRSHSRAQALAALSSIERHVQDMDSKLRDIAAREWRDEGGRIAAAIARDALGMKR